MKKIIIGAVVGGIIIFMWQFLSWTVLDLHRPAQQYTPKQDSIVSSLSTMLPHEGGYLLPTTPPGASGDEIQKKSDEMSGKPWAIVYYHREWNVNMGLNIGKGLIANIFMVGLLCWIVSKINMPTFGAVFLASLFTGIIVFINEPFTGDVWYQLFDLRAHLTDALVSWGLAGVWLGWWMKRSTKY